MSIDRFYNDINFQEEKRSCFFDFSHKNIYIGGTTYEKGRKF